MSVAIEDFDHFPLQRPLIEYGDRVEGVLRDFSNPGVGLLIPRPGGYLYETENGTFDPRGQPEKLFPREINFSYWEKGQLDYILDGLSKRIAQNIDITGETVLPSGISLLWPSPTTSLLLGRNKYLINLKNWVDSNWRPKDLKALSDCGKGFSLIQKNLCRIHPLSSSSTVGHFLVLHNPQEFYWTERFNDPANRYILKDYHRAYKSQLEYRYLGTLRSIVNKDLPKAHLGCLMDLPSMDRHNILRVYEGTTRKENAHPGSLVRIEVTIPKGFPFGPIPYKGKHPTGYIPLSEPFPIVVLDILESLGIPYQIKWSYQILLKDLEKRPWKDLGTVVWALEEKLAKEIYPIKEKIFHWTIAGHMMATYYERNETWDIQRIRTTIDYNPIMALAIIGKLHKRNFLAGYPDALALRTDEITDRASKKGIPEGYRVKTQGDMLVLKENIRDTPGEDILRKIAEPCRDLPSLILKKTSYRSLRDTRFKKGPLGTPYVEEKYITPGPYNRILAQDPPIIGGIRKFYVPLGVYLDGELEALPPEVVEEELNISPNIISTDWIDDWRKQNG